MAIRVELRDGNQVEVVGDDFAEVVRVFAPNLSRDGVYVETDVWLADGSPVRFRLSLADGFALVHAVGEVAWRRSSAERKPGLAIRFTRVIEGMPLVERIVDQHALDGGQPFRLADQAPRQQPKGSPGALAAERRGAPAPEAGRTPDLGGGLEILETLEDRSAPKFAPGLGRAGDLGADPRVRISRNVIASLGGAEEEPAPPPPAPPAEPSLDKSVAELRSLLGDKGARADVLTSTVKETTANPFATQVIRRGDLKSTFGEMARAGLRTPVPATRSGGRAPASAAASREPLPSPPPEKQGASADRRALRAIDRLDEIGAEEPPTPRPGQELRLDPSLLGGEPGGASGTSGEAEGSSTSSEGGHTDPLISASWLLERWENIAGEKSGPPSGDPELKKGPGTGPNRPGSAASARGASGLPIVPILVVAVLGVAGYLAVQRWYLARPSATPTPIRDAATEVVGGTAAEPELASAEPGRTLAAILGGARTGEPAVEIADGALDGFPAGVLQRVTWDVGAGETRILLEGDGAFSTESVTVVRIPAAPPRVLLRIGGILRPVEPPRYQIDSPQVTSLRFGFHQEGSAREAHVVIDLANPNARLRLVRLAPRRLVLVVSGAAR